MRVAAAWVLLLALAATPGPLAAEEPAASLDARIVALEQAIQRDQDRLRDLVARPVPEGAPPLREDEELLEIGRRLPKLQRELAALRDARARERASPPSIP
jgi:hypothetical protein